LSIYSQFGGESPCEMKKKPKGLLKNGNEFYNGSKLKQKYLALAMKYWKFAADLNESGAIYNPSSVSFSK
jgi:hypothetical protein